MSAKWFLKAFMNNFYSRVIVKKQQMLN